MSTYGIGDVQGCYDDLMRLLVALDYSETSDTLWFAGDLINRGKQSLQTLEFIYSLGNRAVSILGNHDLHLLATSVGKRPAQASDTFQDILASSRRDELLDWLRQQPLAHYDQNLSTVMVHAGIYPAWSLNEALSYAAEVSNILRGADYSEFLVQMYGNQPERWSDNLAGTERLRFIVNSFTRMRFVDEQGALDMNESGPLGSQPAKLRPWFEVSMQLPESLKVVFGHWAALGKIDAKNFFPLDSGCVWGNALTAMNIETLELTQVACAGARR